MEYHHDLPLANGPLRLGEDEMLFSYGNFAGAMVPSNGSIGSSGSSSYASSFGPHTPLSGTSTPPRNNSFGFNASRTGSLDSTSSFATSIDSNPFDLSPPSSSTSACFPQVHGSDMCQTNFPLTPSRSQLDFSSYPVNGYESQLSPTRTMDYYYADSLGQSTIMTAPSGVVSASQAWDDQWSKWQQADSPINFEIHTPTRLVQSIHGLKLEEADQYEREAKKRILMEEAKLRATDLHQAQQEQHRTTPLASRSSRVRALRQTRTRRTQDSDIGNIPQSAHHCDFPGCTDGPYRRNEHLKRHQKA